MSTCSTYGAPIIWAITSKGKKMPLNADPVQGFEVTPVADRDWVIERPVRIHVSHFSTCPQAAQHRKAR